MGYKPFSFSDMEFGKPVICGYISKSESDVG